MMDIISSITLAIVQGITEFLPVSSSAHLLFTRKLLGITQDHIFDVFLNIGTVIAILVFYKRETCSIFNGIIDAFFLRKTKDLIFAISIFIASIPTIIIFGASEIFLGGQLSSMLILGLCLVFFSAIIYYCDTKFKCIKQNQPTIKEWLITGCWQVLAVIPGVSRLGITSSALRSLGFDRASAFKYSMILSVPAVCGACFLKLVKVVFGNAVCPAVSSILIGVITAFIIGFSTLKILSSYLQKHTYLIFVIYRIIFGSFIVINSFF